MRLFDLSPFVIVLMVVLAPATSLAQSALPENAPIPSEGALIDPAAGRAIGDQIETGDLPGVDFEEANPGDDASGPGGLANGVGAVGVLAPSQSSSNPVPVETPQSDDAGIPLGAPADQ